MNTGYPPDNFGTVYKKLENQIKALQAKVKCLECCDTITVTEGAPVTDGTTVGELRIDPSTNTLYFWNGTTWEIVGSSGFVGITTLSPPILAPTVNDPVALFNTTTGVFYYFDGVSWEIGFAAIGNGAEIKTIEVNLSSADILGMFATPVVVIPGEVGKVASIIKIVSSFTFGTVAYAGSAAITLRQNGLIVAGTAMTSSDIQGLADEIVSNAGLSPAATLTGTLGADTVVTSSAAITTGDGTIKMFITYQMLSL